MGAKCKYGAVLSKTLGHSHFWCPLGSLEMTLLQVLIYNRILYQSLTDFVYHFLTVFWKINIFHFDKIQAFGILFRKSLFNLENHRFSPTFHSIIFTVLALKFGLRWFCYSFCVCEVRIEMCFFVVVVVVCCLFYIWASIFPCTLYWNLSLMNYLHNSIEIKLNEYV